MEFKELHSKCKEIVDNHYKEKGYPDLTDQQIVDNFKDVYKKLEESTLLDEFKPKPSFEEFVALGIAQYHFAVMMNQVRGRN